MKEKIQTTVTLDEAMIQTGFGIFNIAHMLMTGVILSGVIMQSLSLGYVLPAAQCDLQLTLQQKGWLAALPFIAIILTSHLWGWLADTRGRRHVMLISMFMSVVLTIIASFAPNLITFTILEFGGAVFTSGTSAVAYTYLGEFNNLRHRDKMVTFGASFIGIGTVFLPALCWLILPLDISIEIPFLGIFYRSWRLFFTLCATPYVIAFVLLYFAPESPKFLIANGQEEATLEVLKLMYAVNNRASGDDFPVKSIITETQTNTDTRTGFMSVMRSMRDQTAPLFRMPLLKWTSLTCFVQFGIFATANGFFVWFPTILNSLAAYEGATIRMCDVLESDTPTNGTEICDDSVNTATFERSIYIGLMFCSTYIIVGFLVDWLGKRTILVIVLFLSGVSGIASHLVAGQQLGVILFAVFQMSGACIGLMNAASVELFPTKMRAMAVCLSMMMGRMGSVVGTNVVGVLLRTHCGLSFILFGGALVVCSLLCFLLPGKQKRPSSKKKQSAMAIQNESNEPA